MIVLTLGGLGNRNTAVESLGGYCTKPGNTHVEVVYPRKASKASIDAGVVALDKEIVKYSAFTLQPIDVVAHSQGAEVVSEWLEKYGQFRKGLAGRVRFILTGNPRRARGGAGRVGWDMKRFNPTPNDTDFEVIDIARADDGWCNSDDWPAPWVTISRALKLLLGRVSVHSDYSKVDLGKARVRERIGKTTYYVAD